MENFEGERTEEKERGSEICIKLKSKILTILSSPIQSVEKVKLMYVFSLFVHPFSINELFLFLL